MAEGQLGTETVAGQDVCASFPVVTEQEQIHILDPAAEPGMKFERESAAEQDWNRRMTQGSHDFAVEKWNVRIKGVIIGCQVRSFRVPDRCPGF